MIGGTCARRILITLRCGFGLSERLADHWRERGRRRQEKCVDEKGRTANLLESLSINFELDRRTIGCPLWLAQSG